MNEFFMQNRVQNNLINPHQFDFQQGKSTTHVLNDLIEDIVEGLESRKFVGVTFCDLSILTS